MREDLVITFKDKQKINNNIDFIEDGIKIGRKQREDEIMKIIDDMPVDKRHICGTYGIHIIPKRCSGIVTEWERIDKQNLKQKISKLKEKKK